MKTGSRFDLLNLLSAASYYSSLIFMPFLMFQLDVILGLSSVLVSKSNLQKQPLVFTSIQNIILLCFSRYFGRRKNMNEDSNKVSANVCLYCAHRRLQISWIRGKSRSKTRWIRKPGSLWYIIIIFYCFLLDLVGLEYFIENVLLIFLVVLGASLGTGMGLPAGLTNGLGLGLGQAGKRGKACKKKDFM